MWITSGGSSSGIWDIAVRFCKRTQSSVPQLLLYWYSFFLFFIYASNFYEFIIYKIKTLLFEKWLCLLLCVTFLYKFVIFQSFLYSLPCHSCLYGPPVIVYHICLHQIHTFVAQYQCSFSRSRKSENPVEYIFFAGICKQTTNLSNDLPDTARGSWHHFWPNHTKKRKNSH